MKSEDEAVLWRNSSAELIDAPPLASDLNVDLLVIGGGFTGCAAALQAAQTGASVCVLEARIIAHGGSGRNVGLVNAGLWLPPDTVVAQMGEQAGRRLVDVLGAGPRQVYALIAKFGIDCETVNNGTLHLAHSQSAVSQLAERHRQGIAFGAPLELLDAAETTRRTGTAAYYGSLFDPRAGTIQPLAYCRGLARAAQKLGAAIHGNSAVTGLRHENGVWTAQANGHSVRARALLMATNAYHEGLRDVFSPAFTTVSYCQFATEPLPAEWRRSVLPQGEGCWDTALVMSSFRTDAAGRIIIGGIGNTDGPGSAVHHNWAKRKLKSLFPDLPKLGFDYAWRGRIAMTSDHIPKIVAFGPNAYACFGYSGRGIAPGTVFGTAAASALLNGSRKDLPVEPIDRYSESFTTAKEVYYETGAVLTHMVAG